jgi:hypothetical protein
MVEVEWNLDWPIAERLSSSPFTCHHPEQYLMGRTSPSVGQFDHQGMIVLCPFLLQMREDIGQIIKK